MAFSATCFVALAASSATGLTAFAASPIAGPTFFAALSTTGPISFAARSTAPTPTSTARRAARARSFASRSSSVAPIDAPQVVQYEAFAGRSVPHFGQFIGSRGTRGAAPRKAFRSPAGAEFDDRMADRGRVRLHDPGAGLEDVRPRGPRPPPHPPLRPAPGAPRGAAPPGAPRRGRALRLRAPRDVLPREEAMDEDPALVPEGPDRDVEVPRGVEVAHEDPVRYTGRGRLPAVAPEGDHVRRPVPPDVRLEVRERRGVRLAGVHPGGPRPHGDGDREVPDPREQVHDDLGWPHPRREGRPLREVPGGEHDLRDVEPEPDPVLDVLRLRAVAPEDPDVGRPEGPVDPGDVLDHGPRVEDLPDDPPEVAGPPPGGARDSQDHDA